MKNIASYQEPEVQSNLQAFISYINMPWLIKQVLDNDRFNEILFISNGETSIREIIEKLVFQKNLSQDEYLNLLRPLNSFLIGQSDEFTNSVNESRPKKKSKKTLFVKLDWFIIVVGISHVIILKFFHNLFSERVHMAIAGILFALFVIARFITFVKNNKS